MTDNTQQTKTSYSPFNLLSAELTKRGFSIEFLPLAEKYICVTAPSGKQWISRWTSLAYPFVSIAAKSISINKELAYQFAEAAGVAVPKSIYLPEDSQSIDSFLADHSPVVVKPKDSSGSRGLTLDISSREQLMKAVQYALQYSDTAIVQQQFVGSEVRVTVANGKVVSVILRQPPQVVGDGTSTLAELIAQENIARDDLQFAPIPYPKLSADIIPEHLMTSQTIPAQGEVVQLSKNSLTKGGASLYEISDSIHPSYIEAATKLSTALNPDFLVVDFMIKDYTAPKSSDNYIFVEFNSAPSLRLYFGMRGGKQYDMPAKLVDMIDTWSRK